MKGLRSFKLGFTIIEVTLYLVIAAALVGLVLVGSSTAINQSRARDSVDSLKSFIQDQFGQVQNARNNNEQTPVGCGVSGPNEERGKGDCVIIGRLIKNGVAVGGNYPNITAQTVWAYPKVPLDPDSCKLASGFCGDYTEFVLDSEVEQYSLKWGRQIGKAFSMFIMRAPSDGNIKVMTGDNSGSREINNGTDIDKANFNFYNYEDKLSDLGLCVISPDATLGASKRALKIFAGNSSASGIQIMDDQQSGVLCP